VQKDCPRRWAYIIAEDGGYISTSDVEDDIDDAAALVDDHDEDEPSFGNGDQMDY
jgi:hypothetical protein